MGGEEGSALILIPNDWLKMHGLPKKTVLEIREENGNLVISPVKSEQK